jgi:uncharacterized protein (DUF1800 family)
MEISKKSVAELMVEQDAAQRAVNKLTDPAQKDAARAIYNQHINDIATEAATRSLLRNVYAPDQLREQLTWFWFNHFNVSSRKGDIRTTVGDYEETIRAHSLGKFRDLLEATLKHPAMLRYLDNDQNAVKRINENYAREIMELHSMGVRSGYTQNDVQELARILTGVGVDLKSDPPKLKDVHRSLYIREGVFEFNPDRHDFGDKTFLNHPIKGAGFQEVEQALDLIAAAPATARHVSKQLATYFMGNDPPAAVTDRMTAAWRRSDGDIPTVLRAMIGTSAFKQSLQTTMKDPIHFTVSALRLMYGNQPTIVNMRPAIGWLDRMGESLYGHETPDGYPMDTAAWIGPGQMSARFEVARQIGSGAAGLFNRPPPAPVPTVITAVGPGDVALPIVVSLRPVSAVTTFQPPANAAPPLPQLQSSAFYQIMKPELGGPTEAVLAQAKAPTQWNALFLSSPEFMRR